MIHKSFSNLLREVLGVKPRRSLNSIRSSYVFILFYHFFSIGRIFLTTYLIQLGYGTCVNPNGANTIRAALLILVC
jgi:hypothetical protein